jgi:uncharacterized protein (DUF302 family)
MSANQFILEELSPFNVSETVARLVEEAAQKGWQNPATHNLQQSLAKSGKEVRPVQVVEICKPEYSGKMLEMNDERIVSVLMPCRISVYEKEDGKTYVSLLDMKALASGLPLATAEGIRHASDETLGIVHAVTGA